MTFAPYNDPQTKPVRWGPRIAALAALMASFLAVALCVVLAFGGDASSKPVPGQNALERLVEEGPYLGDPNAEVTIRAYLDPLSSASSHFFRKSLVPLFRDEVPDEEVRMILRPWPTKATHRRAAKALLAAGRQNRMWVFAARLWGRADEAQSWAGIQSLAEQAGMEDMDAFRRYVRSKRADEKLKEIEKAAEGKLFGEDPAVVASGPDGDEPADGLADGELAELIAYVR